MDINLERKITLKAIRNSDDYRICGAYNKVYRLANDGCDYYVCDTGSVVAHFYMNGDRK